MTPFFTKKEHCHKNQEFFTPEFSCEMFFLFSSTDSCVHVPVVFTVIIYFLG